MTAAKEETYIVSLTEAELDLFLDALDEVPSLIDDARAICDALYLMVSDDLIVLDEMAGFLNVAAKGFRISQEREGATISILSDRLRSLKAAIIDMRALDARTAGARSASTEGGPHDDQR